jgi:predicted RNA-binding protein
MCETNAYIRDAGRDEIFLESISKIEVHGDRLSLTSIFGDRQEVTGRILEINFQGGKVIMERTRSQE